MTKINEVAHEQKLEIRSPPKSIIHCMLVLKDQIDYHI